MMKDERIDHCVEMLCNKGCKSVWSDIHALENGQTIPETHTLTWNEKIKVIKELRSIMNVYSETCIPD